ncbi:MAG: hypothetical protein Q9M37_07715 [Desulfonauticus sp.]|nr:hypothetical protein [Desulfonauticus sp.]
MAKVSRRDFLTGLFKKIRKKDNAFTGLSPVLIKADKALSKGSYREAIKLYKTALKQEKNLDLEILKKCAYAYFRLHEFDNSREYFDKVLEVKPREPFCLLYKGLGFAYEGDLEQAIKCWESYFNLEKPFIQREINAIVGLYKAGEPLDYQEVVQDVENAIQKQKKST